MDESLSVSAVPGAHAVHVVSLPAENEPGLQIAHVVAGFESVSAVPGSHSVHEVAVAMKKVTAALSAIMTVTAATALTWSEKCVRTAVADAAEAVRGIVEEAVHVNLEQEHVVVAIDQMPVLPSCRSRMVDHSHQLTFSLGSRTKTMGEFPSFISDSIKIITNTYLYEMNHYL